MSNELAIFNRKILAVFEWMMRSIYFNHSAMKEIVDTKQKGQTDRNKPKHVCDKRSGEAEENLELLELELTLFCIVHCLCLKSWLIVAFSKDFRYGAKTIETSWDREKEFLNGKKITFFVLIRLIWRPF